MPLLCFAVSAASTHAAQLSDTTILQLETVYKEVSDCPNISYCSVVFQYFSSVQLKKRMMHTERKESAFLILRTICRLLRIYSLLLLFFIREDIQIS